MYLHLAMGFGLELPLPTALAKSYALPPDFFLFWRAVEPLMHTIINHHPHRESGYSLGAPARLPPLY
jgi:hypothetical protein